MGSKKVQNPLISLCEKQKFWKKTPNILADYLPLHVTIFLIPDYWKSTECKCVSNFITFFVIFFAPDFKRKTHFKSWRSAALPALPSENWLIFFSSVKQKVGILFFYKLNLTGFVLSYNPKILTIIYKWNWIFWLFYILCSFKNWLWTA